jgi:predicted Zn-dependent protease
LSALSYSRDMEREADDFALAFLRANGMAPAPLIGLFQELDRSSSPLLAQ